MVEQVLGFVSLIEKTSVITPQTIQLSEEISIVDTLNDFVVKYPHFLQIIAQHLKYSYKLDKHSRILLKVTLSFEDKGFNRIKIVEKHPFTSFLPTRLSNESFETFLKFFGHCMSVDVLIHMMYLRNAEYEFIIKHVQDQELFLMTAIKFVESTHEYYFNLFCSSQISTKICELQDCKLTSRLQRALKLSFIKDHYFMNVCQNIENEKLKHYLIQLWNQK